MNDLLAWPPATPSATTTPLARPTPTTSADRARLADWFAAQFSGTWQPWMPEAAVAIASGTDRSEQVAWCQARWQLDGTDGTRRRIRDFRALLSGEIRDDTALERRAALEVLARCGLVEPIPVDPEPVRSLQRAASLVRRSPSLVRDLVVAQELADLLEVAEAEAALQERDAGGPGRPPVGAWRWRRDQALGRVAASRAPTAASKQLLHEALRAGVQATIGLVHDAVADASVDGGEPDIVVAHEHLDPAGVPPGGDYPAARSGVPARRARANHRRP